MQCPSHLFIYLFIWIYIDSTYKTCHWNICDITFFFFSSKHLAKFWCHQFNIRYKYNIVRWLVTSGFDLLFDIIQLGTRNSRSYSSMVVPGSELSLPTFRFNLLILYNSDPSILMGPNTQIWHRMCYLSRKKYKCLTVSKLTPPPPPPKLSFSPIHELQVCFSSPAKTQDLANSIDSEETVSNELYRLNTLCEHVSSQL